MSEINGGSKKSELEKLHDELWSHFGVFMDLTNEVIEHAKRPKKDLRQLGSLVDFIDYKIKLEFSNKKVPRIVKKRLQLTDEALKTLGLFNRLPSLLNE